MKVSVFALAAAPAVALNFGGVKAAAPSMPKLPSAPALPDVPVAAVGAAALAGALALSVGSAAVGDGIVRFGMPFGGEVLVPGAPFQTENGYLGMWCVSRVEALSSAVTHTSAQELGEAGPEGRAQGSNSGGAEGVDGAIPGRSGQGQ